MFSGHSRIKNQEPLSFVLAQMDLSYSGSVAILLCLPGHCHAARSPHMQNCETAAVHVKVKPDVRVLGWDFAGAGGGVRAMAHRCGEWLAAGREDENGGQTSPPFWRFALLSFCPFVVQPASPFAGGKRPFFVIIQNPHKTSATNSPTPTQQALMLSTTHGTQPECTPCTRRTAEDDQACRQS